MFKRVYISLCTIKSHRRRISAKLSLGMSNGGCAGASAGQCGSRRTRSFSTDPITFDVANDDYERRVMHRCKPRCDEACFSGPFAARRRALSFEYHGNYTLERQHLQDSIIEMMLEASERDVERPRLLFTAGGFGAGKSFAMRSMQAQLNIDSTRFCIINPDRLKRFLPEYEHLKMLDVRRASTRIHRESAYIQELLFWAALEARCNILVDGTMRDTHWYAHLIADVRAQYPHVSPIEIAYVYTSDANLAFERARQRAEKTGRVVPPELIRRTEKAVQESIEVLRDLVDRTYYIRNDAEPVIERVYESHARL